MRNYNLKAILKAALRVACILPVAAVATLAQVNLTAGPASVTMPDGSSVPMWGYTCGAVVTASTVTCAKLNPSATGWSPVVITVPTGTDLTINLTNNLSFTAGAGPGTNTVPTSIMIVGQVGGGLGGAPTKTPSPSHAGLASDTVTWSTVGTTGPGFTPPTQPDRVQSFGTEVAYGTTATPLLWKAPRPGTYLIESGTHPSIQGTMGLYGILVVTTAPAATAGVETAAGTAYPLAGTRAAVTYDAEVPLLFSEIDPLQNNAVNAAVSTVGFSETMVWSGQPGGCGNPSSTTYHQCYPPAVNYTPTYYMINGVAFDKTNASLSLFPTSPATLAPVSGTGSVLLRMVNAGSRMHVPAVVGSTTGTTAVGGFSLIAEDGNVLPGVPRVQSEVLMVAGKVYDVMINGITCTPVSPATTCAPPALPVYDRELSLSGNQISRDAGMLAYVGMNGSTLPTTGTGPGPFGTAVAKDDTYNSLIPGKTLTVSDPAKGVIANDINVYGVKLVTAPTNGTVTLNTNGTFTYVPTTVTPTPTTATPDSFTYMANGNAAITATVTLGAATIEMGGITCAAPSFTSTIATYLAIKTPGVLAGCKDAAGYPLTVATSKVVAPTGVTIIADANGGFTASVPGSGSYNFTFQAQNSQGTLGPMTTATLMFLAASNLAVTVVDGYDKTVSITDYRWIIEEDETFYVDPTKASNTGTSIVPTLGVNFHTSHMPFVAQGCTGTLSCEGGQTVLGVPSVCDVGNGACRPDPTSSGYTQVMPSAVHLDPTKRYYISVLPGDAANPFIGGTSYAGGTTNCGGNTVTGPCGHGMGGAPIGIDPVTLVQQSAVTVITQPSPYPTAKLSVFVFEDDFPLNGEQDGGGGVDVIAPNEPGLGGFQIHLWDAMGGNGDFTGQMTYDMFNQPLTNSLSGTIDPTTGQDACPISANAQTGMAANNGNAPGSKGTIGITGMIVTCPKYEADGKTLSPLAGQAVVANLMPGRWGAIATPGADRIARGEEWLQTNTLDGQKAHDVFTRIGEPSYFQEFGPASFHVSIGFANPAIINSRLAGVCSGNDPNLPGTGDCTNTITGKVTGERLSRTPDERLYSSTTHDSFYWTQCFASIGDPDGEDFSFTKCDADGNFKFTGIPSGSWRVTTFDQWNDQLVDGLSTPVAATGNQTINMGDVAATQWQTNLYTRTFVDDNKDGVSQKTEAGIPFANVAVRLRDGSLENLLVTDFTGTANFNETFPLFSWYTVETDTTRYKNTGTHIVYDAGGPADGTLNTCGGTLPGAGYPPCGTSTIGKFLANTVEQIPVPTPLRVPGSVYCSVADCTDVTLLTNSTGGGGGGSTGRIDNPWLGGVEGWQGFPGQNNFIEFGKEPYAPHENGGIKGHVIYASTRPFDDPQMLVQTQWEPLVPHVTINLYQEGTAPDGSQSLTLVDTTQTSSFDDWAQGFHDDGTGNMIPNMSCPGQGRDTGTLPDLFFFSLYNQPDYLDLYNNTHNGGTLHTLPFNSQFKCYDGMHNWNQIQPAPYDGMYQFPSVTALDPKTGRPTLTGTNCTICSANNAADPADLYYGLPMLPAGKYVVEVVLPAGFELVKEEDKNILIGDNFIAPVTQEFGGLSNIFIIPDQASVAQYFTTAGGFNSIGATGYNANNPQNPTQSFGMGAENGIVPGFIPEPTWPCVGEARIVPDYISLYPQSKQVSPFAGATRNLCDRKEVTLSEQAGAIAKFYIYTSTHIASKFTGGITDDYTSEFDPFSPQFGEKFSPPNLPVSVKDWAGNEVSRIYADHWGSYDGMTYSTWEVNPPNPTGYSPTMMVMCMNDPGPIPGPGGSMITDPAFTQGYSQFCYELPFMPGTTQYLDTPVVPTSAFAGAGYNNVDCYYPDSTPAVKEVDGDSIGPWVSAAGKTLTITSLGDQLVPNYAYSGPSATTAPFNTKTINRHYGFLAQCMTPTASSPTCNTASQVTIGGIPAAITNWTDTQITVTVPFGVPNCGIQQQALYGGSTAQCGQLAITNGNGRQSIDTVTVTIGGSMPKHIAATDSIQTAIDNANPGDLLIIDPTCNTATGTAVCTANGITATGITSTTTAAHNELVLMWKPVRLQGVGAASSIINANTHPAGKLDAWRRRVDCLFGLSLNASAISTTNPYDPTGAFTCSAPMQFQVDRIPFESTVGWDANLNGNLAEMLQEPSLMGALEGAGITVLAKGADFHGANPFDPTLFAGFPTTATLLTAADCATGPSGANPYPSNFQCNPSSIDGLGVTNSSQGGGGIYVHAWAHNLQIANDRVYNNSGTLSGGINVGQGEFPTPYLQGSATNAAPGSCETSTVLNAQLPYCHNLNVSMHNNAVMLNNSTGDELFSATPAGAGGVSICTGSDYYKFNFNWVCGNLSTGDGGGIGHLGFSKNGDIEHNTVIFNQSINPTIAANGGGMIIMGTPDVDPTCGTTTDADCVPNPANSVGPSDGVGPGLVINANLIQGNAAESGTGGGISFQNVNGSDVLSFPVNPENWHHVVVTNNIIVDNVAGWDGAGVSMLDALNLDLVNNTIASNSSTASAGVLFTTLGGPLASTQNSNCIQPGSTTTSCPQVAGVVSIQNSAVLVANLPAAVTCPPNHFFPAGGAGNGSCIQISYPLLANNVIWQNISYFIGVGATSPTFQQNVVALYNASFTSGTPGTLVGSETATGVCVPGSSYWDIGVRGDTGPNDHSSTFQLNPRNSVLSDITSYTGQGNLSSNPRFVGQYCDGSRTPPEFKLSGWQVPPGISDATVPNPIFNLTPVATVDEGNNWVNMRWGPLSLSNAAVTGGPSGNYGGGAPLGNYALEFGSPAIDHIAPGSATFALAPSTDFFGNPRPNDAGSGIDVGAVETGTLTAGQFLPTLTSITPNSNLRGNTVSVTIAGTNLSDVTALTGLVGIRATITGVSSTEITANFIIPATATLGVRNVGVTTVIGPSTNTVPFTVLGPTLTSISQTSGLRGQTVGVTLTGVGLTGATAITGLGGTTGVTVTSITVVSDTSVKATLTIGVAAPLGPHTIGVTTAAGATTSPTPVTFTVVGPTLTSITPTSGVRGTMVPVTLSGTGLAGATAVNMGGNITCTGIVTTATTVNASCAIARGAGLTTRNVTVTTPIGTAAGTTAIPVTFTVTGATVSFAGPTPALTTGAADRTTKNGTLTVNNAAAASGPLTLTAAPTITRATGTGTFSITGGTCVSGLVVNPGNSCTINIQYAPPGTGGVTSTGHVTITGTGIATATLNSTPNFTGN